MSTESQYYDLLHAYALGCLDLKDLIILNEFLDTGEEYFWQELGEYQNLAALLPSILNIETPGAMLKDKVARKLYSFRNEKRTKQVNNLRGDNRQDNAAVKQAEIPVLKEEKLSSLFTRTRIQIMESELKQDEYKQLSEIDTKAEEQDQIQDRDYEPVLTKERVPGFEDSFLDEAERAGGQSEAAANPVTGEYP